MNHCRTAIKTIGGAINNCLTIQEGSEGCRILVGNNDETIKVVSVPDMGTVTTIPIGAAVNYLSISPNGKMLACVGDTNDVLLFDIGQPDSYKMVGCFKMEDSGFSVAWSRNSMHLAAGSQDGTVHVWDVRSIGSSRLARLSGQQACPKGAIRNVKFSQAGSIDLLGFTEHCSVVNLVDARTYEGQDQVQVAGQADVNLSGMAWTPDGRSLCVGMEAAVLEYKVEMKSRLTFPHGSIL